MRVALVHDWLLGMRGGEKVLAAIASLFPQAELFTLLVDCSAVSADLLQHKLHTSWLQQLPGVKRYYRKLLPWMPRAIEQFRFDEFDLVISSSHCVAKGVNVPSGVPHICYCHTPMRYAWDLQEIYLERVPVFLRRWARRELQKLQRWDCETASKVTHFIANGRTVQERIQKAYGRESCIIHPPVDTQFYVPVESLKREDYYLVVSALAPNKRIDLAIAACQQLKRKLIIIGTGPEESRLRKLSTSETCFLGWGSNDQIRHHLQRCAALLFPGEEDFGIVPIEANACGCPVIAYGKGGATETVKPLGKSDRPTGVWFMEATTESLIDAIRVFELEKESIEANHCRLNAEPFGTSHFITQFEAFCSRVMHARGLS